MQALINALANAFGKGAGFWIWQASVDVALITAIVALLGITETGDEFETTVTTGDETMAYLMFYVLVVKTLIVLALIVARRVTPDIGERPIAPSRGHA